MGEEVPPNITIEIELGQKQEDGHKATKGILRIFRTSQYDTKHGNKGKEVLEVPVVSGGEDLEGIYKKAKKGIFKNRKATTASKGTGSKELKDKAHGGGDNIIIRLYDDILIHQGNNEVTQEGAYTKGCIAITAYELNKDMDGNTDIDRNYEEFSKIVKQAGGIDVIIK